MMSALKQRYQHELAEQNRIIEQRHQQELAEQDRITQKIAQRHQQELAKQDRKTQQIEQRHQQELAEQASITQQIEQRHQQELRNQPKKANTNNDQFWMDEQHPILRFTHAVSDFSSSASQTTKTIIEHELEKLIQLDSSMADHDFDDAFLCPISTTLMLDPVMVISSGNTYDRKTIEKWFATSDKDPVTNLVANKALAPNMLVRKQILDCLQKLQTEVKTRYKATASHKLRNA